MFSSLASGVKSFGLRFSVVLFLPVSLLVLYLFGLWAISVASPHRSLFVALGDSARVIGVPGFAGLLTFAVVFAVITLPFQIGVVRLLEGYWGAGRGARWMRAMSVEVQRRHVHLTLLRSEQAEDAGRDEEARFLRARLDRYPRTERLLPTALGNALRASEDRAGDRYGLSTPTAWPRLYYCLPESVHRDVAEMHQQIDGGARLTLVLIIAGIAGCPVLLWHGWWNLVWIGAFALAFLAYRGAVTAAMLLRPVQETAFDLFRFALLDSLHLQLPDDATAEARVNKHLSEFWRGAETSPLPTGVDYVHHNGGPQVDRTGSQ
jgi:hypothetical protein